MADLTMPELYAQAIEELNARYRFESIDNLLTAPTDLEKEVAIYDAVGQINAIPPGTDFTVQALLDPNGDPRWKQALYLGTGRNIIQMLLADWTANGFSLSVEEFSVEDRLDRYNTLYTTLDTAFTDRVTQLKEATQKHIKHAYAGNHNPLIRHTVNIMFAGQAVRYR